MSEFSLPEVPPFELDGGIAWSPDDALIAVAAHNNVHVLSATTGALLDTYEYVTLHKSVFRRCVDVAWAPIGMQLAIATRLGEVCLCTWDGVSLVASRVLTHPATLHIICWSPDATRLAGGSDESIMVWNVVCDTEGRSIFNSYDNSHEYWTLRNIGWHARRCVAWFPDGTHIAETSGSKLCVRSVAPKLPRLAVLTAHERAIISVSCLPDSRTISGDWWGYVCIWSWSTDALLHKIRCAVFLTSRVCCSPDGLRFAVEKSHLFSTITGKVLCHKPQPPECGPVHSAWSHDGTRIAFHHSTWSSDGKRPIIVMHDGTRRVFRHHDYFAIRTVCKWSPRRHRVFCEPEFRERVFALMCVMYRNSMLCDDLAFLVIDFMV